MSEANDVGLTARFSNPTLPLPTSSDEQILPSGGESRRAVREQVRLDTEQISALVRSYQSGVPIAELLCEFGIGRSTLHRILRSAGVPGRKPLAIQPEDLQAMKLAYEAGATLSEIATNFRVGYSTVRRRLASIGVEMRQPGRRGGD